MPTINYLYPGSGTTGPTVAQARVAPIQTVQVTFADGDTTVTLSHNYNLDTTALNRGCPLVDVEPISGTNTLYTITAKGTSTVTIGKASTAGGSGGTVQFDIQNPHSILMPNT